MHFNRNISFGEFYTLEASSGTICISNSGGVTSSENINLLGADAHQASATVSTKSEAPVYIRIEVWAERLQSQTGNPLTLTLNAPEQTFYTVTRGKPTEIELGGCLEITPGGTLASGDYNGVISIDVFILNK